jgi:hypothetical protein
MDFFEREAEARGRSRIFSFLFLLAAASTVASVDLLAWAIWEAWHRYFPIRLVGMPAPDANDVIVGATALTVIIMVGAVVQKSVALSRGGAAVLGVLGLLVVAVGSPGACFGGLFRRAVSRERELLADAEAVQFTRNPGALAGTLKKIGSLPCGAAIGSPKLAQVSHFLFVEPDDPLGRHRSLQSRIRALEPDFEGTSKEETI